jgi:hypothetical protein
MTLQALDIYDPRINQYLLESTPLLRIPRDELRRLADEWLGPHRPFDQLHPRDQEILLLEIEADILDLELQIIPIESEPDKC